MTTSYPLYAAIVEGEVVELKEKLKAAQMESARLTMERDEARNLANKLHKKLKKHNALSEVRPPHSDLRGYRADSLDHRQERRKILQQRVLDLEAAVEKSESAYRLHIQKERDDGRGETSALQKEYEEKVHNLEQTLTASSKQVPPTRLSK